MNLASKLDRLRRPTVAASSSRTERVAGGRSGSVSRQAQMAALVDALGADVGRDDLLLRRSDYALPPVTSGMEDLTRLPEVYGLSEPDWVYIDTETTGLSGGSGSLAFMVGAARYTAPATLEVRQYVLGSFAAESRMLRELLGWLGSDAVLVSYNGKSFDVPLLNTRLGMHRLDGDLGTLPHLDLVYSVRRAYSDYWPDCRLQTAEKRLLGMHRVDDLPGSEAPAAWQSWLRGGETAPLARVLAHNCQDVVSLALLHRRLLPDYAGSFRPGVNHAAVGRSWRQSGHADLARQVWERAGSLLDEGGSLQLAGLYRRLGEWSRAEVVWLKLHARGSVAAALALSKYYEHRKRDFRRAIDFANCCGRSERDPRFARLQKKIGGNLELPLSNCLNPVNPRR